MSTPSPSDRCMRPSLTIVGAHDFSRPPVATPAEPWSPARDAPSVYERLVRDRTALMGVVLGW